MREDGARHRKAPAGNSVILRRGTTFALQLLRRWINHRNSHGALRGGHVAAVDVDRKDVGFDQTGDNFSTAVDGDRIRSARSLNRSADLERTSMNLERYFFVAAAATLLMLIGGLAWLESMPH